MNENKIINEVLPEDSELNKYHRILSKITIKFWCLRKLAYEVDGNNLYFVNSEGMVVMHVGLGEIRSCSQIEAHFYQDGERIA